jgi:hypothetical protein
VADEKLDIRVLLLGLVIGNPNKPGNYIVDNRQDRKSIGTLSGNSLKPIKFKTVFPFVRNTMACADVRYKNKYGELSFGEQSSLGILAHRSKKTLWCVKNINA